MIPVSPGVAALAARYDVLILDLWGVVHDGVAPYPGALDCLARLRDAGKHVVIVSNAPRPAARVVEVLRGMAIDDALYGRVVTSGDAVRAAFVRRADPWYAGLGRAYLFLGKESDGDLLEGLDYRAVAGVEDADFVLNAGLAAATEGVEDYDEVLRRARARALPMVCANPDLVVVRGGRREPCAGALALRYAELGGAVRYEGKPHRLIYELCFEGLTGIDRRRILAVGDVLETDIAGARGAGIDSLLVTGGVLADAWGARRDAPPDPARLAAACAQARATPTFAAATFAW